MAKKSKGMKEQEQQKSSTGPYPDKGLEKRGLQ
jgi:hypothetical protein